jgi:hypothetical protein
MSSMFKEQLLGVQIPNSQNGQSSHQCLFALLGPTCLKAACKMLMKLTPGLESMPSTQGTLKKRSVLFLLCLIGEIVTVLFDPLS